MVRRWAGTKYSPVVRRERATLELVLLESVKSRGCYVSVGYEKVGYKRMGYERVGHVKVCEVRCVIMIGL